MTVSAWPARVRRGRSRSPSPDPCLRATQLRLPAFSGVSCAVTTENEGVCWGDVVTRFGSSLASTSEAPSAVHLGPALRVLNRQHPLCVLRPGGALDCLNETYLDGFVLSQWGVSAKGFARLHGFEGATEVMHFGPILCALLPDGDARCHGSHDVVLGVYPVSRSYSATESLLEPGERASGVQGAISIGYTCIVLADGRLRCLDPGGPSDWCGGTDCNCGAGHSQFELMTDIPLFRQLSTAHSHRCGVTFRDDVVCWGRNDFHEIGPRPRSEDGRECFPPVVVAGIDSVEKVEAMGHLSCALKKDGTVWCWGSDPLIGNSVPKRRPTDRPLQPYPTRVQGLEDIVDFSVYYLQNALVTLCALRRDGLVLCVGGNQYGQAGIPLGASGPSPEDAYVSYPRPIGLPPEMPTVVGAP